MDAAEWPEIVVTPEMVDAGLCELQEYSYAGDTRYMLEAVFRAMAYANLPSSVIGASDEQAARLDERRKVLEYIYGGLHEPVRTKAIERSCRALAEEVT